MATSAQAFVINDLRGGRNGSDPPLSLPDTQCCEAMNVDWWQGTLARRRGGCSAIGLTFSSGGPFGAGFGGLVRHVPGTDESAAELWAADGSLQIGRLAAGTLWTEPTIKDAPTLAGVIALNGVSLGGFLFLFYDSAQNRGQVWDSSISKIRRTGLATPSAPSAATQGGAGLTFTRYYRIRYLDISGSDTRRMSEPSASTSISITDDQGVTVTKPASISEDETHWRVEYADASDGPWYVASSTIVVGTTTYSDTASTIDTSTLSEEDGLYTPPASFKYGVKGGGRLLMAGPWETSGGYMTPLEHEVWWTPVLGATDIGDLERVPPDHRVSLDHAVVGLSEAVNGVHYAFGSRAYSKLVPTGLPGEGAFQRLTESTTVGCLRAQTIVMAEDENGRACVYWLSHKGPYRRGAGGEQYCGNDIEDIWARVNLDAGNVGHGVYYADKHQIWWWIAIDGNTLPNSLLKFDTRLGRFVQTSSDSAVLYGWSRGDGTAAGCNTSVMFSDTIGASMSLRLVPYASQSLNTVIFEHDTGTDDNGTDFQAYIDTKEYAPNGLGKNCTIVEPHLVAEANSSTQISVTARVDFGRDTSTSESIDLAPDGNETHVQKKVAGLQIGNIGTVRFRIGEDAATDQSWTLDAFVARVQSGVER